MEAAQGAGQPGLSLDEAKARVAEKVHPKVTADSITAKIADVIYHRVNQLTICVIRMRNGFYVTGQASPADPRNFDPDVGQRYAYEDAFKKIWPLEGYLLREALWQSEPEAAAPAAL